MDSTGQQAIEQRRRIFGQFDGLNAGVGEQILHGAAGKLGQRRGVRRGGLSVYWSILTNKGAIIFKFVCRKHTKILNVYPPSFKNSPVEMGNTPVQFRGRIPDLKSALLQAQRQAADDYCKSMD